MRYLFLLCAFTLGFALPVSAQGLSPGQREAATALLGSRTPLWFIASPGAYRGGGVTLGHHMPTQDRYLTLRYVRQEQGHVAHLSLSHHTHAPRDGACLSKEKEINYTHPQLGSWRLCSSVNPHHEAFAMVRAFASTRTRPYLRVDFVGPPADLMQLMGQLKPLPQSTTGAPEGNISTLASRFYGPTQQVHWQSAGYAAGDNQLFWKDATSKPQWNQVYHRAIPYYAQQVTLHMTALFRHTPHSQIPAKASRCSPGQTASQYVHPRLGPYRLCSKTLSTPAHPSGTDQTPLVHQVVYARPLAGNKRPHVSFHLHGLPQEMQTLLGQLDF